MNDTPHDNKISLNAAGKLTRISVHAKLIVLFMAGIILFGILALEKTPRTYNPEIIVPAVSISVSRPGSNTQEILHHIIRPLEALMASIPGVEHTYGIAHDEMGLVTVRFKVNENEETSLVKVYNQINSNLDKMPPGTLMPLIRGISLYDVPLLTITLHSKTAGIVQLRKQADRLLEKLRSVPQVGKSWVMGQSPQALRIWPDLEKMTQHGIAVSDLQEAISTNNINRSAGTFENPSQVASLQIHAALATPDDLRHIIVGTDNGKPILLQDVATVTPDPRDTNINAYFALAQQPSTVSPTIEPAVTIALARQKGSNGVTVAAQVLDTLQRLQDNHSIPKDITTSVTRNYGDEANDAVNTLVEHLGVAILSVVILLMLFLGWREASIVIVSIPLILCLVLGIGWLCGQTINRITLFALILSLGLLVDDSIVVIENIHRHILKGVQRNFTRLVIYAANEIGKPTIIATFTVMLALFPMAFVGGMMGPFMAPIPFNAPLAMFVSLIIAYSIVPYLAYRGLKKKARYHMQQEHPRPMHWLQRVYCNIMQKLIQRTRTRHAFYACIVLLLISVLLQPLWQFIRPSGTNGPLSALGVAVKMLPDDNVNTFLISINSGAGTSFAQTTRLTKHIARIIQQQPEVTDLTCYIGEPAPEDFAAMVRGDMLLHGDPYSQIRVNLTNKHHRTTGSHAIATHIYRALASIQKKYPQSTIKLFESPPGPPVPSQMEAGLYGSDYANLQALAHRITQNVYPTLFGMINADNSVTEDALSYHVTVDHHASTLSGLSPQTTAHTLSALFQGLSIGSAQAPYSRTPEYITLQLPPSARKNPAILQQLCLKNRLQECIPLHRFAHITRSIANKPVFTRDQTPVVYLTGEVIDSSPAYAVASATKILSKPPYSLKVGNLGFHETRADNTQHNQLLWLGEMRLTLDVFRDLGSAFIIAILLIYILLAGFYRSFFIPCIIMGAIPLTIIGVFPGHWLMQQPFTATSMIGVIALAGIVVRNSLLLIDFILEHQHRGTPVSEAVLASGVERIIPIVLTALAIILGSAVMLSDPVFGGLAIALIFGSFASTVLTLFLIPLLYLSWWKRSHVSSQ